MTGEGGIDYSAVLADLEAKRDTLDKAIIGIRAMLGLSTAAGPAGSVASGASRSPDAPVQVGRHEFVGMSTPEATKKYLQKVKRLASPREIARALIAGGLGENEETVYTNVYSALKRYRKIGEVVKHRQEWGLASQFPNLKPRAKPVKAANGGDVKKGDADVATDIDDDADADDADDDVMIDVGDLAREAQP
jgi:hypothetical protein